MNHDHCVVLTTTNNKQNAEQMIRHLLEHKLAACVQILPIESHYLWEGNYCQDNEFLLVIKTQTACYFAVEKAIEQLHCYEIPQIIQLPITQGFEPYLAWLKQTTTA
ncbi:periplasmic divalent cation tolerance protein cutA [Vibrio sp. RC586]|uniref:divalent-cation tolerance protein CutA n=1 Tax=Vibrio sp. RC586 TaxID=675815 RepID=UPI0001BB7F75|nr:divalent-cation tolerance protein CutA [Vibrio sp. RC586]EEY99471.1 periplasmic divalent cation tolerance protein cutA [Vibrio sp. RC586]